MVAASPAESFDEDQRVVLHAMAWQDFEALLAIRGDRSGVRMYYLDGEVEIVSPTKIHEGRKKTLARLLEAWGAGDRRRAERLRIVDAEERAARGRGRVRRVLHPRRVG